MVPVPPRFMASVPVVSESAMPSEEVASAVGTANPDEEFAKMELLAIGERPIVAPPRPRRYPGVPEKLIEMPLLVESVDVPTEFTAPPFAQSTPLRPPTERLPKNAFVELAYALEIPVELAYERFVWPLNVLLFEKVFAVYVFAIVLEPFT